MNIVNFTTDNSEISNFDPSKIKIYMNWGIKGMAVTNFILGCIYLVILNAVATRGFDLENIKSEQVLVQKQLELVDIETTIPSSIYALESNEIIQEMPRIGKKIFFAVKASDMAFVGENKNF